jgi:hypothetical protein
VPSRKRARGVSVVISVVVPVGHELTNCLAGIVKEVEPVRIGKVVIHVRNDPFGRVAYPRVIGLSLEDKVLPFQSEFDDLAQAIVGIIELGQ